MASTKLTALKVEHAKPIGGRYTEIADRAKPGLYLVIQTSGHKSWAVRYRYQGKSRKLTLKGFPSLIMARKLAQAAIDRVADGGDPAADKKEAERKARNHTSNVIDDAFRLFLDKHLSKRNGQPIREVTRRQNAYFLGYARDPKNPDAWVKSGGGVLVHWSGRTVQAIKRADVYDLLDEVKKTGPIKANRTLSVLKTFFRWLTNRDPDLLPKGSPCQGIGRPNPENKRKRTLKDDELVALWNAAEAEGYPFGTMVQLLILTGCRRDEVRKAPPAEFTEREWVIAGERTKNGRDHVVPITDTIAAVLETLPCKLGRQSNAVFLFTTTGDTPVSGLAKLKDRLDAAMAKELEREVEPWTLHDLRRTFMTGLLRLRIRREVAEACVNHKSGGVSGVLDVYDQHDYLDEKREALEAWSSYVMRIVNGAASANVVELRPAAAM